MRKLLSWIPAFAGMTRKNNILLTLIVIAGAVLRFTNLNWDSFQFFHPDERNISWAVTRIRYFSELNPRFFAYGGLPIYLYRAIGEGVVFVTKDTSWLTDWGKIAVMGRVVSAILSSVSIVLIYRVGSLYFSPAVGVLAAFILSFSPWAIREAHFATTESMLVFFLLLLLIVARQWAHHALPVKQRSSTRRWMRQFPWRRISYPYRMGLLLGLSATSKSTSLLFGIIPVASFGPHLWVFLTERIRKKNRSRRRITHLHGGFLLASFFVFVATVIFTVLFFSPYTILDRVHFLESMRYETGVATGKLSVPYTLQFTGTLPYVYQVETMLWQAGPISVVGMIGLFFLIVRYIRTRRYDYLLFLSFPLVYFAFSGSWFAKFSRYNVPFLPFVTIAAAWLTVVLSKFFKRPPFLFFVGRIGLLVGLVGFHVWWGLSNWAIYLRPQTRFVASEWIYEHIPSGSTIYTEHWNDGLPIAGTKKTTKEYKRELLTVYEPDNQSKLEYYASMLARGDYIILSTRRIWATMPKLRARYPLTSQFYRKLASGELGYTEVATFTSYPELFGLTVSDESAEESIQVYDHPTVRIFQNSERFSIDKIRRLLESG